MSKRNLLNREKLLAQPRFGAPQGLEIPPESAQNSAVANTKHIPSGSIQDRLNKNQEYINIILRTIEELLDELAELRYNRKILENELIEKITNVELSENLDSDSSDDLVTYRSDSDSTSSGGNKRKSLFKKKRTRTKKKKYKRKSIKRKYRSKSYKKK